MVWKYINACTVIILIGAFLWNNSLIFIHFYEGKTVTSSLVTDSIGNQIFPTIFACRKWPFSGTGKDMAEVADYLDNTLNLNNTLWSENPDYKVHTIFQIPQYLISSTEFEIQHVYSYTRGHCYAFRYLKK